MVSEKLKQNTQMTPHGLWEAMQVLGQSGSRGTRAPSVWALGCGLRAKAFSCLPTSKAAQGGGEGWAGTEGACGFCLLGACQRVASTDTPRQALKACVLPYASYLNNFSSTEKASKQ